MENFPHLETLDLHDNRIVDISGLTKLTSLRNLNLSSNLIEVLELPELKCLVDLNLRSNKIRQIKKMVGFPSLAKLNLGCNRIAESHSIL